MTKLLALVLLAIAVLFEVGADFLFKQWSAENRKVLFLAGMILYGIGTVGWAYALRFAYLTKAVTIFTAFNLLAVVALGVLVFHEPLSLRSKVGILFALLSIVLLERS